MATQNLKPNDQHRENNLDTPLQNLEDTPILFGCDVVSLYPNLDPVSMARIAADSVRETRVQLYGINYMFLIVYLMLVMGADHLKKKGLGHCLPKRMTGNNSNSLVGELNKDMNNWDFKNARICKRDKIELLALMVQIMVLLLSRTTCYKLTK